MKKSCIAYRERSRVAVLHEDLLEICDGNMLAAMLLSILIYWTDVKLAGYEQECEQAKATGEPVPIANLWIWKSHEGFQHDLMNDKDGMRKVHRTTIATALKLLQDKQFIASRRNPRNNIDQTRQYRVDTQCVQSAIRALPSLTESIKTDNRMSEIMQSNVGNHAMDSLKTDNALPNFRQAIPEITNTDYLPEITNTEETTYAQSAHAIAPHAPALKNEDDDGRDDTARGTENAGRADNRATGNALARGDADAGNPAVPVPEPKKPRTRKPKIDTEMQQRIERVYACYDKLMQDVTGDPDVRYPRFKVNTEAILALLPYDPSPAKIRKHYLDLYQRPREKNGWLWQEHMAKLKVVIENYMSNPQLLAKPQKKAPPPQEMDAAARDMAERRAYFANQNKAAHERQMAGVGGGR